MMSVMDETEIVSESEEETCVTWRMLLKEILENDQPMSMEEPGYIQGLVNLMTGERDLEKDLANCLTGFTKMAQIWQNNITKATKKGVIDYLESCKGLTGILFGTSFDSTTMESLKHYLNVYKTTNITREDCSKFAEKILTSTSSTTAAGRTARAGATGGTKRKRTALTLDEIDVDFEDLVAEQEDVPTLKAYSSITVRRKGEYVINKSEEKWKEYNVRVTLYRKEDLLNVKEAREKWNNRFQEVQFNMDTGDDRCSMIKKIINSVWRDQRAKGGKWEPMREFRR